MAAPPGTSPPALAAPPATVPPVTTAPGHPDAGTVSLTGFEEKPEPVKPNFGSIVAKHRGHRGDLPPFISIARGVVMDGARRIGLRKDIGFQHALEDTPPTLKR